MTREVLPRDNAVLLTVCVPTYKGAAYLPVVLEALLPQAARESERVEVVVVDDCSPDDTSRIVRDATAHGPVRYIRNNSNAGMSRNIVAAATQHARGEFVWMLSQHNLLAPGGLADVLTALESNRDVDALYLNFRAARYPEQWPVTAVNGYDGAFEYISNSNLSSRELGTWEEILDARSAVATQTYAHVIRRALLVDFWATRPIGREFTCALDTYSQTVAVASTMFGRPAKYVGKPVMTIFNGAQTWGSLQHRAQVHLMAHPDLLEEYSRLGWRGERLEEAQLWASRRAQLVIAELARRGVGAKLIGTYLSRYGHHRGALRAVGAGLAQGGAPRASQFLQEVARSTGKAYRYFFHDWRPARWIRARAK